jgi:hypothetical protein
MAPKEKAIELFDYMHECGDIEKFTAKKFAIKVVDEIIQYGSKFLLPPFDDVYEDVLIYLQEVKQEIEKL